MIPEPRHRYPEHVIHERQRVSESGSFRERVQYDLVARPSYAFGVLAAADIARFFGYRKVTVIEFGVANGDGLLNLCNLTEQVSAVTNIEFRVLGFDNAIGLPEPVDYRDHPEIWSKGDFRMTNRPQLEQEIPPHARLLIGPVSETLPEAMRDISDDAPVGFVAHDMDIYSSTVDCLKIYESDARKLLPVSIAYFDDTLGAPGRIGTLLRNEWCGQLLAINEFNRRGEYRKIDIIRTLPHRRPLSDELWLKQIYAIHALDHPLRNSSKRQASYSLDEHQSTMSLDWPY